MPARANQPTIMARLAKELGIQGSLQLLLDEVVVPTFQIGNLSDEQSAGLPAVGRMSKAAGGAGTYNKAFLNGDQAAGTVIQLQGLLFDNDSALALQYFVAVNTGPQVTTALAPRWRDGRENGLPAASFGYQTSAGTPGQVVSSITVPATSSLYLPFTYTLSGVVGGGTNEIMVRVAANLDMKCTFFWSERRSA